MNAWPGEPEQDGQASGDATTRRPEDPSVPDAAATWVPPESPGAVRPAWLPPGARPGEPYGPPYGQPHGQPHGQPPPPIGPYGGPQPYGNPYGPPPPYGAPQTHQKPRMPRWAKIVLVVGVGFYLLSAVAQLFNLTLLHH